jgi:hypothetical protein
MQTVGSSNRDERGGAAAEPPPTRLPRLGASCLHSREACCSVSLSACRSRRAEKTMSSVSGDEEAEINVDSDSNDGSCGGASDGAGSDSAPPSLLSSSKEQTKLPFSISRLLGADFDSKASSKLADAAWDVAGYEAQLFGQRMPPGLLQHGLHYAAPGGAIIRVPAHRPPSSAAPTSLTGSPYPWLANIDPHLQRSAAFASHLVKERLTGWSFFLFYGCFSS